MNASNSRVSRPMREARGSRANRVRVETRTRDVGCDLYRTRLYKKLSDFHDFQLASYGKVRVVLLYFPRLPVSPFSLSDFINFPTSQFAAAIEDDGIISDKLPCGLGKIDSTCSSSIFLKYFNN